MKTFYRIHCHNWKGLHRHTFQSGSGYLIVCLTQGNCFLSLGGKEEACLAGDILFLKPGEVQTLYTAVQTAFCQVLSIYIPIETLENFSDKTCDFYRSFSLAPQGTTIVHSEIKAAMSLRNILQRLVSVQKEREELGAALYEKSLFTIFLVVLLRACVESDEEHQSRQKKQLVIDELFSYISRHLTEDLSLKALEQEFFVSGEHISREFKKSTGVTLHVYITRARIDLAKRYILQGTAIRDVYQLCGFGSYNHFFKAFKKECQMTPMAYYRSITAKRRTDLPPG